MNLCMLGGWWGTNKNKKITLACRTENALILLSGQKRATEKVNKVKEYISISITLVLNKLVHH